MVKKRKNMVFKIIFVFIWITIFIYLYFYNRHITDDFFDDQWSSYYQTLKDNPEYADLFTRACPQLGLNYLNCIFFAAIALLRLELALLVLRLRRLIAAKNLQFMQFNLIEDTP